jgi:chorismate dehydratase
LHAKLIELNHRIRVGAVSYLNTKPLLYGIKNSEIIHQIDLIEDYPSKIADLLISNQIDLGLIPVASLKNLNNYFLVSDYCIGSNNEVSSVGIFSDVPLNEIETIYLDYQSRTSVMLTKILCAELWKILPEFKTTTSEFSNIIENKNAGLVIGDRAFVQKQKSKYYFDLGLAWKELTGLPFVYATWVANKKLPDEFLLPFNNANALYKNYLDIITEKEEYSSINIKDYFENKISYEFTEEKKRALSLFLSKIKNY